MSWLSHSRTLWRLVREIDTAAIQADAEAPFRLGIVGDTSEQAVFLARYLMSESRGQLHPWLAVAAAGETDATDAALDFGILVCNSSRAPLLDPVRRGWGAAGVPFITVLDDAPTAADLTPRGGETARVAFAGPVGPAAAFEDTVVRHAPARVVVALARQLPALRPALFKHLAEETATANATYAFTTALAESVPVLSVPLNVADIVVLTKNQLVMAYKIALGAGKSGRARDVMGEVLGVIGSGFLFRQGARQLIGLMPVVSIVPKVAMAYAGTWAIGQAVALWATKGQAISTDAIAQFARDARGRGRRMAESLLRSRDRLPPSA